eukprot:PhF_6_TR17264/c0_g1_i1/m.26479
MRNTYVLLVFFMSLMMFVRCDNDSDGSHTGNAVEDPYLSMEVDRQAHLKEFADFETARKHKERQERFQVHKSHYQDEVWKPRTTVIGFRVGYWMEWIFLCIVVAVPLGYAVYAGLCDGLLKSKGTTLNKTC